MTIILENWVTCCLKSDLAFAAVVAARKFICCCEIMRVEESCQKDLVSKGQELAPAAFEVFRGRGVRQPVGSHRVVDLHVHALRCGVFPFRYGHIRSKPAI